MIKKYMIFFLLSFSILQGNYCIAQNDNKITHEKTIDLKEKNIQKQQTKMHKKVGMLVIFFLLLCSLFFYILSYHT